MKIFKFRLERILRFKEQVEQQKRIALSDRNEALKKEKKRLVDLALHKGKYMEVYGSLFHGRVNVRGLKTTLAYIDKINGDMFSQARRVVNAETRADEAKIEVRDSMRDRKKYEKLKERKRKEHDFNTGKSTR